MKKILFLSICALLISNCAHKRGLRLQAKDAFYIGEYKDAEDKILSDEVISETKNKLLTLMDLGIIANARGEYEKSNKFFFKAKDLARKLYTESVSQIIMTGIMNDNSKDYMGMDYEISLIHYYVVLNFISLAQAGESIEWKIPETKYKDNVIFPKEEHKKRTLSQKEIASYYGMAKSEVLAWDSFLETVRNRNKGKPYYKDDILAKTLGAYIHRIIGTTTDLNTAKLLYRDGKNLLVKSYSAYPTFNLKSEDYQDNYKKFPHLGARAVKKKFIKKTNHYESLEKLLNKKIKKVRRRKKHSTLVVLEAGMVPEKREKKFTIGLSTLFSNIEDPKKRQMVEQIGARVILQVAPALGVTMVAAGVAGHAMSDENDKPQHMTDAVDSAIGFVFKLPSIPALPTDASINMTFKHENGKVYNSSPTIVNAYNDIASLNVNKRALGIATKTGVRVGTKYLMALLPAIATYKATEAKAGAFAAQIAAAAVWIPAKKAVDATENADIRAWNAIPMFITMDELSLPPGKYAVSAKTVSKGLTLDHNLGEYVVKNDKKLSIFRKRITNIMPEELVSAKKKKKKKDKGKEKKK